MRDYTENITFFYDTQEDEETSNEMHLSYSFSGGMNVAAFHRACKRFGYALGFAQESLEKYFGEDNWEDLWED